MGEAANKKILIVEDEEAIRIAVQEMLRQHGFSVLTANNGKDGLAIALHQHPSLVLLDIFMPQMDGLTVLEKLRADDWGKDVPVIIHTNLSPDSDTTIQAIMTHKPAFYLMKADVTLEDVVSKIKEVLQLS
jgi:CheY-like chemotaxis protein